VEVGRVKKMRENKSLENVNFNENQRKAGMLKAVELDRFPVQISPIPLAARRWDALSRSARGRQDHPSMRCRLRRRK
jgi:hypothetical protein